MWTQQNGLCAYCDVLTVPPDGEGVATCCKDYIQKTVFLSETAKFFDIVLCTNQNMFVCMACAKVHAVNRLDKILGFTHSETLYITFPIGFNDNHNVFFYIAACSGLHLVFSIFLCEVFLHAVFPEPTVALPRMSTRGTASEQEEMTIMVNVKNIREAELVYIKVHVAKVDPAFKKLLKAGLTIRHPNTVTTLAESSPDSAEEMDTTPSRRHVFRCIVDGVDSRLTNFLHEIDDADKVYAGRLFVYLCQLIRAMDIPSTVANSGIKAWESLRDALKDQYTNRNGYSAHDIGFSSADGGGQDIFREETVLLMRRDTHETLIEPTEYVQDVRLDQGGNNLIMESIVLLQPTRPTALMTLNQSANEYHAQQHHLYCLVAVYDFLGNCVHWLDVENWNFIKTVPTCESSDLRWFGISPSTDDPSVFDDTAYSFEQMQLKLTSPVVPRNLPRPAAIRATRYICFYQRLTRNRGCDNHSNRHSNIFASGQIPSKKFSNTFRNAFADSGIHTERKDSKRRKTTPRDQHGVR